MADPTTKEAGPVPVPSLGPAPPLTPASPDTLSPLTPTGTRPRLGPRRQSRFTEDMTERTPAASVSERSLEQQSWYGPSAEDVNTNTNNTPAFPTPNPTPPPVVTSSGGKRTLVRVLNGVLHAVPCGVLLGILGCAMSVLKEDMGSYMSIEAVILISVLSADVVVDVITLLRARSPWSMWGLGLRLFCGLSYIALFLVYVGMGGPFPEGYTYWGVSTRFAAPVVYILLCVEGMWNLLHAPACLFQLRSGTLLRRSTQTTLTTSPTSKHRSTPTANPNCNSHLSDRRTSFPAPHRFSVAGTDNSSISLTWRRWVRTRSTQSTLGGRGDNEDDVETGFYHRRPTDQQGPSSADLTLRELPGKEGEGDEGVDFAEGASSRGCSSHGEKEDTGKWGGKDQEDGNGGRFVRGADIGQ